MAHQNSRPAGLVFSLGGRSSLVDIDMPGQRVRTTDTREATSLQSFVHLLRRMDKCAEIVFRETAAEVLNANHESNIRAIPGIRQTKDSVAPICCTLEERFPIRIAAHGPVEDHDIRSRDVVAGLHEIALLEPNLIADSRSLRFCASRLQKRRGRVGHNSGRRTMLEQFEGHGADAGPDIQNGRLLNSQANESLKEKLASLVETLRLVPLEISLRTTLSKMGRGRGAVGAAATGHRLNTLADSEDSDEDSLRVDQRECHFECH